MAYAQSNVVKEWLEQLRIDLIAEYDRLGLRASGNYEKSLYYFATDKRAIMYGAKYAYQMQYGRNPGTYPPRKAIEDWIDAKKIELKNGISKSSLAYLIQRKIFRDGIKVPNKFNQGGVISNVITEERIDTLLTQLKFVNALQISSDIIEIIKAA
ncbi:MAG TPA: hypothetical protein PKI86_02695 [Chitinophagales bacterium]|nr:hypothetical protein [Chitinophagales bacterium]